MKDFELMLEEAQSDEERQSVLICEACDINIARAELAYNTFNQMDALQARAREVKMNANSGDFDKMVAFYEAEDSASAAAVEKKKGLIARIWEAIKTWWNNLWNGFKKQAEAATPVDENAEVEVSAHTSKIAGFIATLKGAILTAASKLNTKAMKALIAVIGTAGVAGIVAFYTAKKIKMRAGEVNAIYKKATTEAEAVDALLDKAARYEQAAAEAVELDDMIKNKKAADKWMAQAVKREETANATQFVATAMEKKMLADFGVHASFDGTITVWELLRAIVKTTCNHIKQVAGTLYTAMRHPVVSVGQPLDNAVAKAAGVKQDEYQEEAVMESWESELDAILAGTI